MFNIPSSSARLASERIFSQLLSRRCSAKAQQILLYRHHHVTPQAQRTPQRLSRSIVQRRVEGSVVCSRRRVLGLGAQPVRVAEMSAELRVCRIGKHYRGSPAGSRKESTPHSLPQDRTAIPLVNSRRSGPLKPNMPSDFRAKLVTILVTVCTVRAESLREIVDSASSFGRGRRINSTQRAVTNSNLLESMTYGE